MKVSELIDALKLMPQDAEIAIHEGHGYLRKGKIEVSEWTAYYGAYARYIYFDEKDFKGDEERPNRFFHFVVMEGP